ncbi:unconventional prefoldin RPB5 interactor-like protein [Galleria mellonella]|uniref:Unconventional prefoldin RPB5 interactor-like protein n=1 Tax=Galleria mellonella TaxID=7137 RepID=A0A6J1WZW4_GALME|nr:unconventional prefoldin RPB5 interactor-like protein [Galleria mellonella]
MNIIRNANIKSIYENASNLQFWEDYLNNLKSLDFSVYSDKLTVPTLVPIGNKILFRGYLKHTNEVTVSLGADYFAKCSLKQAEILRQHRIKDAQSKVDIYTKEKEYLENQLLFKNNVKENVGQEIIEVHTDEEDKAWREKHSQNVRNYKKQQKAHNEQMTGDVTDEELWYRLEELELQEELENQMLLVDDTKNSENFNNSQKSLITKESDVSSDVLSEYTEQKDNTEQTAKHNYKISVDPKTTPQQTSKLDLLQQVLDKQTELEQKLTELKCKERTETKTEQDLIARLDEMDALEELEDEIDRLENNILEANGFESDGKDVATTKSATVKRGVSFADEDDSETIDIVFKHSTVEPSKEPYNPDNGMKKPSDIYYAYPNLFNETTSILKKTKYDSNMDYEGETRNINNVSVAESNQIPINKTIVVSDIIERTDQHDNKLQNESRPTSLFRKKRLQNKSSQA